MKKIVAVSALMAFAVSASCMANPVWDYVGAGYTDAAGDGPYVEGSFRLDRNWVADISLARLSKGPFDANQLKAGLNYITGFTLDFSPNTQTYLLGGVENWSGDADETGAYAGLGMRHPLTPQVELYTEATYHTVYDSHGSLAGGIAYFLSPDWAVRGNLALNSGDTKNEFRFGVSYQF
ncbi:membrane protein [Arsukibacterium sp. MJ3]|uniref:membrane protein n=1 Tax=Arsukibacterium sp. MJ3 TaxID=1632859 RepID=UPI0006270919|nr:membrane protein [Arsukibacterium sp. MJ3]KKO48914.1 membrane protein [Arsukibacterium sp. MJ3]